MFSKLAFRNVRRSVRDYSVYFLTLVFGVCVFYTFNALDGQSVMQYLSASQHYAVASIRMLVNVFSVFVSIILAAVVLYANTFMMKRRKKELGTYFLLGMPAGKVSALLFLETLLIGAAALVVGIALGVLFSFGLSALSVSLFEVNVDFLKLTFSPGATVKTVIYFGVMFLLVMIFNGMSVSRCKLIDLIQASRRNEDMKEQPLGRSVVQFLLGVALIVVAYVMLLTRGLFRIDLLFWLMLALGSGGTLLFFRSLSGFLLKLCRGNKGFYYKGLNMFTLRQFNSRVHTNYLSMTVICLMLLLAIGITACAVGMNNTISQSTAAPYDLTVYNYSADTEGEIPFLQVLKEGGVDTQSAFSSQMSLPVRYNDSAVTGTDQVSGVLALSHYNALLAHSGKAPIALEPGECRVLTMEEIGENLGDAGITLAVAEDETAEQLPLRRQIWLADYAGNGEETEAFVLPLLKALNGRQYTVLIDSRLQDYADLLGSKVLVIVMGLYLGSVFLLASAAVLALQQLSQAADNAQRYTLLAKLGAERKQRDRSVFIQVLLAFLLPLALAIVHAIVGMTSANEAIAAAGKLDTAASSAVTAVFLVVIYGAYFLLTCLGCRRLARGR